MAISNVIGALSDSMPKIFEQAQVSGANHQKNYVSLNKLHHEAASYTQPTKDNMDIQLIGEKAFEDLFISMLLRVLPIKKGATVVDRIIRFVAGYIQYVNEKERRRERSENEDEEDTPVTRFLARFFRYLIKGFDAKDKTIRYRVVQIVAETVSSLTYIDEDVYDDLRSSLMERVQDKEAPVRTQAVIALSNLVGLDEDDDSRKEMIDVLLDMLVYDSSAEVRRAALMNIPLTPPTVVPILSRLRDTDSSVRRTVYTPVLEQLENPRQLTLDQRKLIVRAGLRDRDKSVRSSACKLLESWLENLECDISKFVRLFDLNLTMEDDWCPAEHALLSLLRSRGDILDSLELGDKFMNGLSTEKAFLGRVLVDHCIESNDEEKLENVMPVLTAVAFEIENRYGSLMEAVEDDIERTIFDVHEKQDSVERNKEHDEMTFILGQLLKISINLDFADEQGRRKMFSVIRKMASQRLLPDSLVSLCLDILRTLSTSEKDLIRIVVEIIHELRDSDDEKDDDLMNQRDDNLVNDVDETPMPVRTPRPPRSADGLSPDEKRRADEIDLRCLSLCIGMLERVNSSFEENSTLEGILGELILPSVKRKEINLKEKGLMSLGLCCLIARRMALNSFHIFLRQVLDSPAQLKTRILQIVFDIMMVHKDDILGQHGDVVITTLLHVLATEESAEVQTVICTGFSKLLLSGMVVNEKVLMALVHAYMSPHTADNQGVRQCLSYFFPVYSYTSPTNQRQMQKIFLPALRSFFVEHKEYEDSDEMYSPLLVGSVLVDWTNSSKALQLQGQTPDNYIHFDLAVEIVKTLFDKEMDKDEKRVLCQLLNKLYMPEEIDDDKIRTLKLLIDNIRTRRPLRDAASNTALTRFDGTISKKYEEKLKGLNEEEFRQLEELKELFAFLDDIIPDEEAPEPRRRGSRKRRSESIATSTATSGPDEEDYKPPISLIEKAKNRVQLKRRRVPSPDAQDPVVETAHPPSTRSQPRRMTRSRAPIADSDVHLPEDSDSESIVETMPPIQRWSRNVESKSKGRVTNRKIGRVLLSDKDSIMDSDSEPELHGDGMEEDDEVNGLL